MRTLGLVNSSNIGGQLSKRSGRHITPLGLLNRNLLSSDIGVFKFRNLFSIVFAEITADEATMWNNILNGKYASRDLHEG